MKTHCFLLCEIGSQLFIFLSKFGDGFFILFHGPLRTFEIGFPVSICKETTFRQLLNISDVQEKNT